MIYLKNWTSWVFFYGFKFYLQSTVSRLFSCIFEHLTDQICKKLSSIIRWTMQASNLQTETIADYSLFESHLSYSRVVWGGTPTPETNLKWIFIRKKRAVRCLTGFRAQESWREAYRDHTILTVILTSLYIVKVILQAVSTLNETWWSTLAEGTESFKLCHTTTPSHPVRKEAVLQCIYLLQSSAWPPQKRTKQSIQEEVDQVATRENLST